MRRAGATALLTTLLVVVTALPAAADAAEVSYRDLPRPDLEVFMQVDATDAQVQAVVDRVRVLDGVSRYAVLSRRAAYREFERTFAGNPELVRSIAADDFPRSVRLGVGTARAARVRRRLAGMGGVDTVATARVLEENRRLLDELNDVCRRGPGAYEIFMAIDAGEDQVGAVRAVLDDERGVARFRFVDHADAYAEFERRYREDQDLVRSLDPEDLAESFRVVLSDPAAADDVVARIGAMPGVELVSPSAQACDALRATGLVP